MEIGQTLNATDSKQNSDEPTSPKKTVHFADSIGLSLTSMRYFLPTQDTADSGSGNYNSPVKQINVRLQNGSRVTKILNFRPPPTTECLTGESERRNVRLEEIICYDGIISGRIRVRNIAFEKTVTVRYTTDSWLSYKEVTANYVPGSNTGSTDSFEFEITFTPSYRNSEGETKRLDFAICYKVGRHEFWDNNFGDNYRIVYC